MLRDDVCEDVCIPFVLHKCEIGSFFLAFCFGWPGWLPASILLSRVAGIVLARLAANEGAAYGNVTQCSVT